MSLKVNLLRTTGPVHAEQPAANATTSTIAQPPNLNLDDLLHTLPKGPPWPPVIGTLFGMDICVDPTLKPGVIVARDPSTGATMWRAPVDHPLIAETKLGVAAREFLEALL